MKKLFLPMNLQFFAEDGGADGGSIGGSGKSEDGNEGQTEFSIEELSDDQLESIKSKFGLKNNDEIDSIVKSKKTKWQNELEEKKMEAAKLAKMNAAEAAEHEKQKLLDRIKEFEQREANLEMAKTASEMLGKSGIVANEGILSLVVKDTAEATSEGVKAFIDLLNVEKEKIRADFEKRLGTKIPLDGTVTSTLSRGEQMAALANKQNKEPELNPWA